MERLDANGNRSKLPRRNQVGVASHRKRKHVHAGSTGGNISVTLESKYSMLYVIATSQSLCFIQMAFAEPDIDAVYLLSDGKPDTSTSLVLKEVARINLEREVKVHTISFNCDDACVFPAATNFKRK